MNTLLRHVAWMLCGLLATGAGSGCNGDDGKKPPQMGTGSTLTWTSDSQSDMADSGAGDMAIPGPTCEAAKGLAADKRLLCVDFKTALPDAQSGWTFQVMGCGPIASDMGVRERTWTVANGALILDDFEKFGVAMADTGCSFTSPLISDATSYKSLTLSIEQNVDLRIDKDVQQRAQILLESTPPPPPLAEFTGKPSSFRRSMVTISASEVQDKSLKFNLVTRSSSGGGYSGWQIRSIAVLGHK